MKKSLLILISFFVLSGSAFAEIKTITLDIPKMDCPLCPVTIKAALNKVEGVTEVDADLDTKSAMVSFDDTITSIQSLIEATTNAGYPSDVKQ